MPRARNVPATRKRRKKVLKKAKGYFGNKSRLFRYAKDAVSELKPMLTHTDASENQNLGNYGSFG